MKFGLLFLLIISASIGKSVYALNTCRSLFEKVLESTTQDTKIIKNSAMLLSPLDISKVEPQKFRLSDNTWSDLFGSIDYYDAHRNSWMLDPEDNYIKVSINSSKFSELDKSEYIRKILFEIQRKQYSKNISKKTSLTNYNNKFINSIFVKTQDGYVTNYTDIDFLYNNRKTSINDFNLKRRSKTDLTYEDWSRLVTYLGFIERVYSTKMGISETNMQRLKELSLDFMNRSTIIYSDTISTLQKVSTEVGLLSVESQSSKEALPSEVLHGISIRELVNL